MPKKNPFKPCPFCGCRRIRLLSQGYGFSVDCERCGAMVKAFTRFKVQAYAEWNNRRPPDPLPQEAHDANYDWDWTTKAVLERAKKLKAQRS